MNKDLEITDYQQFTIKAKEWGCVCKGTIGTSPTEKQVALEEWAFPRKGGFILAVHKKTKRIGVYAFVGNDGDSLIHDLTWLREVTWKQQ